MKSLKCEIATVFQLSAWMSIVVSSSVTAAAATAAGCVPEKSNMAIFIDSNTDDTKSKQMAKLTYSVLSGQPDGSEVTVNLAGNQVNQIAADNIPYSDLVNTLSSYSAIRHYGDTMSHVALDDKMKEQFTTSKYRRKAEIAVILVNDATKLDQAPEMYIKKKTFVIVFGHTIQSIWRTVATRDDHLYLVKDENDLETVIKDLIQQINCDSHYKCDRDKYREEEGASCEPCSNKCPEDVKELTGACGIHCPYLNLKLPDETTVKPSLLTTITKEARDVSVAVQDGSETVGNAIIGTTGAVLLLIIFFVIVYCTMQNKKTLTPVSSEETLPKVHYRGLPKVPVQEIGDNNPERTPLVNPGQDVGLESVRCDGVLSSENDGSVASVATNRTPIVNPGQDNGLESVRSDGALSSDSDGSVQSVAASRAEDVDIVITFKNKAEMDLNAHYGDDDVHDLHGDSSHQNQSEDGRRLTGSTQV